MSARGARARSIGPGAPPGCARARVWRDGGFTPPLRPSLCRLCARPRTAGRRSVKVLAVQQQVPEAVSRRQQLAGLAALASFAAARPAQAGLFDGGKAAAERYEKDTVG